MCRLCMLPSIQASQHQQSTCHQALISHPTRLVELLSMRFKRTNIPQRAWLLTSTPEPFSGRAAYYQQA